jgi:hypothetical protein
VVIVGIIPTAISSMPEKVGLAIVERYGDFMLTVRRSTLAKAAQIVKASSEA